MKQVRDILAVAFFVLVLAGGHVTYITAATAEDIQQQINDSNTQISQLKDDIARLQTALNETAKQKETLKGAISEQRADKTPDADQKSRVDVSIADCAKKALEKNSRTTFSTMRTQLNLIVNPGSVPSGERRARVAG
jgi:septal ring factor EnvC (AmiA/AmiB activator)